MSITLGLSEDFVSNEIDLRRLLENLENTLNTLNITSRLVEKTKLYDIEKDINYSQSLVFYL